ncbi:MAG TPA: SRPBCC family protein [Cerasibacillus sp.]|uniref:SRPBCC family protein n=1 Tax=Cerasibacillus sp. TaxID=2498711 RepID=UPI002F40D9DB
MTVTDYQLTLDLPLQNVWTFLDDFNNWASFVDGYINHREINPLQSIWTFKGEFGLIEKSIRLRVDRVKTTHPYHMLVHFSSLQNKLSGEACLHANDFGNNETKIDATIKLKVKGMPGPLIRPIVKNMLPKMLNQLGKRIKTEILRKQPALIM